MVLLKLFHHQRLLQTFNQSGNDKNERLPEKNTAFLFHNILKKGVTMDEIISAILKFQSDFMLEMSVSIQYVRQKQL